jgi:hypothetical protein
MRTWLLFGDDLVALNGYASLAAGLTAWLRYDMPVGIAALLMVALFVVQCLCLLSRYTAWLTALIGSALMATFFAGIGWLIGEHYAPGGAVPIVSAIAGGLAGGAAGVFGYRELIQKIRLRPERS